MKKTFQKTIRFLCAFSPEMYEKLSNKIALLFENRLGSPIQHSGRIL